MNSTNRLKFEAPDLVAKAARLSDHKRVSLARAIAAMACRRSGVLGDLDQRLAGLVENSALSAEDQDKVALTAKLDEFDEKYFESMDATEDGSATEEGMTWLYKARAIASLNYAIFGANLLIFCEAVYEATVVLDGTTEIRGLFD